MNDPNGLVYANGVFHLFHQYNPLADVWGHMAWNHATSKDLVHWTEHGPKLIEEDGVAMFSGSAILDEGNTSALGPAGSSPLVTMYTGHRNADGFEAPCLAHSDDGGLTWQKHDSNPVLPWESNFRDPKVFRHGDQWIMVIVKAMEHHARIYTSGNLIDWTRVSTFGPEGIPADNIANWECPDLIELPVENEPGACRWVLHVGHGDGHVTGGSGSQYFVGTFDGKSFTNDNPPETILFADYGPDNYAAITWNGINAPNGGKYYIGWMSNWKYANIVPTMGWRNGLTIPRVLTLRNTESGYRLVQRPAPQLDALRGEEVNLGPRVVDGDTENDISDVIRGQQLELDVTFTAGSAREFGIDVLCGAESRVRIGYDVAAEELFIDRSAAGECKFYDGFAARHHAPLTLVDGLITLRIYIDVASVEVFAADGLLVMTQLVFPPNGAGGIRLFAAGGSASLMTLRAWPLTAAPVIMDGE